MKALLLAGGLAVCLLAPSGIKAQGCAQCRSGVEQGSQQTQAAYRRGIGALCLAGAGLCAAGFVIMRRFR